MGAVGVPGAGLLTSVSLLAIVDASGCWYATIIFVRGIVVVISRRRGPKWQGPKSKGVEASHAQGILASLP